MPPFPQAERNLAAGQHCAPASKQQSIKITDSDVSCFDTFLRRAVPELGTNRNGMRYKFRMNSSQCRAARALLKWSQTQLADASGVALSTVADFEIDKREPRVENLTAIRRALEDAGIEFIPAKNGKGVGVRLREDQDQ
jgi:DNA-binding XRE family transcriptional regulator